MIAAFLMLAGSCFAATPAPSDASLNGEYVFHITTVKEAYWYKSESCKYSTGTYTYGGGGQRAYSEIIVGEATFNGHGGVTIVATEMNKFNMTASNASVTIPPCPAKQGAPLNINDGTMVLENQAAETFVATYTVKSDGTGVITLPGGQGTLNLNLAAFTSTGLSTTVLMLNPDNATDTGIGIAVHK